ncbi:hypothetical protein N1028_12290 [Herbiconiux sp. CPCC 203407]|uniref:Uncharacterized protein n=1 Tax=Herbiconiux oxytropis TaxID=2970915 RepID=A0AA41XEE9_9MICO|nr:hypothetical protein [Herbiconiux oxytropis]MCS5721701.1 hypothetical protein [Herbiconiux oxytropis]MCS5726672.1 hypothetical protein [Herbiconiux oxytropis]
MASNPPAAGRQRPPIWPEHPLIESLASVIERGHGAQVLLGADIARASRYTSYRGMPGLAYLGRHFVPRLTERIGAEGMHRIAVTNPARFLTWHH